MNGNLHTRNNINLLNTEGEKYNVESWKEWNMVQTKFELHALDYFFRN